MELLPIGPTVTVTARTSEADNYSTRILTNNNFVCVGTVWNEEDGEVWKWKYQTVI